MSFVEEEVIFHIITRLLRVTNDSLTLWQYMVLIIFKQELQVFKDHPLQRELFVPFEMGQIVLVLVLVLVIAIAITHNQ